MRCAPPAHHHRLAGTGLRLQRVDAAAERCRVQWGGGQALVQVCKGEGKMVVGSEEENREEPDGEERRDGDQGRAGTELGGLVPWEEGVWAAGPRAWPLTASQSL